MRIGCSDLNGHVLCLVQSQILEVRARIKGESPPGDARAAFGRRDADRVGKAGAIVIAVDIRTKRGQINIHRRTTFNRCRNACCQSWRIIRASYSDGKR
ncbi:hypothetical protein PEV8663_04785 [Pelagimonas varians]|uniref:Uncharacterized protein n=1 Tax=Pelagimonas varians TaxID=696760 RepID=A0A238L6L9_9RHOB|nr:hypothetical protein PEV8663_04785 [Pelagimonas varians]